jgi:1-acyl-sn-glycerol-3-phosphate acyltransferase
LDHVYFSTKVVGRSNVPTRGAVILAGNHTGLVDGPVVLGAAGRGTHFIMKFSLGQGVAGVFLRLAGQVPVEQSGGRGALRTCLALLRAGRVVGIFPEGTRGDGQMRRCRPGVGWLAVKSGAPVVPFACLGSRRQGEPISFFPRFGRRLYVSFGEPLSLDLDPELAERDRIAVALEQIGAGLAAHVARAVADSGVALPSDSGREEGAN